MQMNMRWQEGGVREEIWGETESIHKTDSSHTL